MNFESISGLPSQPVEPSKKKKNIASKIAGALAVGAALTAIESGCDSADNIDATKPKQPVPYYPDQGSKSDVKGKSSSREIIYSFGEVKKTLESLSGDLDQYFDQIIKRHLRDYVGEKAKTKERAKIQSAIKKALFKIWKKRMGSKEQQDRYFASILNNPEFRAQVRDILLAKCQKYNLSPEPFAGIMAVESGFNQDKHTSVAYGISMVGPKFAVASGVFPRETLQNRVESRVPQYDPSIKRTIQVRSVKYEDNQEKYDKLAQMLQSDMEINIEVMVAGMRYLLDKYGDDWGIALAIYNGGPTEVETRIVEIHNQNERLRFERESRQAKKTRPIPPRLETRGSIFKRGAWKQIIRQNNITYFDLFNQSDAPYEISDYPLAVLALEDIGAQILFSSEDRPKTKVLVETPKKVKPKKVKQSKKRK